MTPRPVLITNLGEQPMRITTYELRHVPGKDVTVKLQSWILPPASYYEVKLANRQFVQVEEV